ncbi:MAG TPA: C39 family peptidase [Acidobacteriaceae bacterium]|nr:C39 family peptidase [Acidobacteriaceae bacterium]
MLTRCAAFLLAAGSLAAQTAAGVWIDVPFVPQPRDGCGAASISMVMEYWAQQQHRDATPASDVAVIQHQLYSPRLHGITPAAMEDYLRQHGYLAFALNGRWTDLQQQLNKGRPVIVALRPRGQSELHFVVIAGIDSANQQVMMNDPAVRKLLAQDRAAFEKDWSATHDWMLLAVPAPAHH